MILLKNNRELEKMRAAGRIAGNALRLAGKEVKPGVTTAYLDSVIRRYIEEAGAKPSFLGYGGFPASACISINDVVIHGIPSHSQVLRDGDIVSIDVGAYLDGFHGDTAATFACGSVSEDALKLMRATEESLYEAIRAAVKDARIGDIGHTVEAYVTERGYSVVRDFVGHGVGASLHEDPQVPNYGKPGRGIRLSEGMTIAIEPMVCAGRSGIYQCDDGWTVKTKDKSWAAHYEHTVAITAGEPLILTTPDLE